LDRLAIGTDSKTKVGNGKYKGKNNICAGYNYKKIKNLISFT
jgi:hypothetical protein